MTQLMLLAITKGVLSIAETPMFLPRQENFQQGFEEFAVILVNAAQTLHTAIGQGPSALKAAAEKITDAEHEADRLGMKLFNQLHKSFMTPYDPEDILALIHYLDDIVDGLEDVAHRMNAYQVATIPPAMLQLSDILVKACVALTPALKALSTKGNIIEHCMKIGDYESEIDGLTRSAIAELFRDEKNAIELLKKKEIYEFFEETGDACAHVATVLGRIQVKGG
jgi:uncharacterized protein